MWHGPARCIGIRSYLVSDTFITCGFLGYVCLTVLSCFTVCLTVCLITVPSSSPSVVVVWPFELLPESRHPSAASHRGPWPACTPWMPLVENDHFCRHCDPVSLQPASQPAAFPPVRPPASAPSFAVGEDRVQGLYFLSSHLAHHLLLVPSLLCCIGVVVGFPTRKRNAFVSVPFTDRASGFCSLSCVVALRPCALSRSVTFL